MKWTMAPAICLAIVVPGHTLAKERDPVKVESPKDAKGVQSVVIGSFAVAFVTEKTDEAFAGGRYNQAGVITRSKLANVDPAVFQAITDAAYADFQKQLAAAGFAIAGRDAMLADKHFANATFAAPGAIGRIRYGKDSDGKATYFSPTAFAGKGLLQSEVGNGEMGGLAGGLGKMTGIGAFMKSAQAFGSANTRVMYSALNHQPVISALYVVDFAGADRYGGRYALQAGVNVKANLAVVEGLSTLNVVNDKGGRTTLTVAEPIAVGGDFGSLADTTSGGTRAGNILGKGIAMVFGKGNSNAYNNLTFTAATDRYQEGATQATVVANARLIARLAALR